MTAAAAQPGVVVVTGGESGIGLATCTRLAGDGFTVAALDIQPLPQAEPPRLPCAVMSLKKKTSRRPWRRCWSGSAGSTCW